MNTMEITKFVGAVCGSLLIFLLLQLASHAIFDTHSDAVAFAVEGLETGGAGGGPGPGDVDVAGLMAAADVRQGRDRLQEVRRLPQARRRQRRRPAPRRRGRPPGRLGRGLQLLRRHAGARRRLDARGDLRTSSPTRRRTCPAPRWPSPACRSRKTAPTSSPTSSRCSSRRASRSGQQPETRPRDRFTAGPAMPYQPDRRNCRVSARMTPFPPPPRHRRPPRRATASRGPWAAALLLLAALLFAAPRRGRRPAPTPTAPSPATASRSSATSSTPPTSGTSTT